MALGIRNGEQMRERHLRDFPGTICDGGDVQRAGGCVGIGCGGDGGAVDGAGETCDGLREGEPVDKDVDTIGAVRPVRGDVGRKRSDARSVEGSSRSKERKQKATCGKSVRERAAMGGGGGGGGGEGGGSRAGAYQVTGDSGAERRARLWSGAKAAKKGGRQAHGSAPQQTLRRVRSARRAHTARRAARNAPPPPPRRAAPPQTHNFSRAFARAARVTRVGRALAAPRAAALFPPFFRARMCAGKDALHARARRARRAAAASLCSCTRRVGARGASRPGAAGGARPAPPGKLRARLPHTSSVPLRWNERFRQSRPSPILL
ncbi:plectin [Gracilaria domingensis]|nr:plectin [Gracilaria domingensis]